MGKGKKNKKKQQNAGESSSLEIQSKFDELEAMSKTLLELGALVESNKQEVDQKIHVHTKEITGMKLAESELGATVESNKQQVDQKIHVHTKEITGMKLAASELGDTVESNKQEVDLKIDVHTKEITGMKLAASDLGATVESNKQEVDLKIEVHMKEITGMKLAAASANSGADGDAAGGSTVFVYGGLLADEVVQVLFKRVPPTTCAILNGYHRFSIKERIYPAILPVENKRVRGRVLHNLSATELDLLDIYDVADYEKRVVNVTLEETSVVIPAYAYVWANSADPDIYGDWDFEEWKESNLKEYLRRTELYVKEMPSRSIRALKKCG